MAREPDADSRPISVAELMARARELDSPSSGAADDQRGSTPTDSDTDDAGSDGSGRRRRGGAGSVSFAELTGELPRLTDTAPRSGRLQAQPAPSESAAPAASAPSADTDSRFVPDESTSVAPDAPETGRRAARPFPRSEPPRPARDQDAFPRSEIPVGRPPAPQQTSWAAPDRADQGRGTPPPTRDISSGAIADRFRAQRQPVGDDAVETGIIPRVDDERPAYPSTESTSSSAPSTGSLDAIDLDHLSPQEREREFERYRNFEDIDALAEAEPETKKRRGLFGGLRRSKNAVPGDAGAAPRADRDDQPPSDDATDDTGEGAQWDERPWSRWPTDDAAETDPGPVRDPEDPVDTPAVADADTPFPIDSAGPAATDQSPAATTEGRRRRDVEAETQVVDLDKAQVRAYDDQAPGFQPWRSARDIEPEAPADDVPAPTADTDTGPSPARQWAMLGVQVVVGLAVGVGLFLGFHELWKWNVYFALVLAVVVMFGLVTTVHVVRRSQDLISTLLALGVGLIVTIGPLVLLASGS